jgi:glycosyltransferase involved in cell wall biosynthesis
MKVIHVPFCFRPDPVGGTEVYVEALAREQQRRGIDVIIAAPAKKSSRYTEGGLPVRRFRVTPVHDVVTLYGEGDHVASSAFGDMLDEERPHVVHLHAFTSAVSARLARTVQQRGIPVVFTYHTPTASCQRGTLLRWGHVVCDGRLDVHRCAACTLHGHGVSRRPAMLLGAIPSAVGQVVGGLGASGGPWTALRMSSLVELQQVAFRSFVNNADRVVVLCQWARDLLLLNNILPEKIVLSRHGLTTPPSEEHVVRQRESGPLRIAFLGRLHPTKGVDILLLAVSSLPEVPLKLDIFGVAENEPYMGSLRALADGDRRVRFRPPVPSDQVVALLREYDVLAVPSRWLETGPLVVLEAFAAGIPVVGSKLGGLAELIEDGTDGLLVEPQSVPSMSSALRKLAEQADLLSRLRTGVRPPRRMEAVADDMQAVYGQVLAHV